MNNPYSQLAEQIQHCMLNQRFSFNKTLKRLRTKTDGKALTKLQQQVSVSVQKAAHRKSTKPEPRYDKQLPVCNKYQHIHDVIKENQVTILCGETGSGKTTQIPKICLDLDRGIYGMIGHTQPRRIAARSVANRIAEELATPVGQAVGYKVRFSDSISDNTYIKLMTDGILLAETHSDPFLQNYDTLIIDEAHERSLNIDFLLGYVKNLLPKRPDLKVIITSATIDPDRFSKHFNDAPIIEVSGRTYPVEVRYRPLESDSENESAKDQQRAILDAVDELTSENRAEKAGDILVFLSGERHIREASEALRKHHPEKTEIIPLFSRLSHAEQQRVFKSHAHQRIILATNVAETSLTIPGIRYVIDTGYARISRYSYRTKVQRLPIEKISQASANQRKGRCGRVSEGICIRLYSEEDFNSRPVFTDAEILRTNLANVILQMHQLRLGDIEAFPFIDKPDNRFIKDGYRLLEELQAIEKNKLTRIGKRLAQFSIEPRYARMLVAASKHACLNEVLVITSALSIQDPRERPMDKQQKADEAHSQFKDIKSDFVSLLNLWQFYQQQRKHLSQNKLRKLCKKIFVSYVRMEEWRDIHNQLNQQSHDANFNFNPSAADYDNIHQALLSGLLSHIGLKNEDGEYNGARGSSFAIFPGSGIKKKKPLWLMANVLMETQRLYGMTLAQIEPEWIEKQAQHLIKHDYFEPHWEKRPAQVAAFRKSSLYGLVINPKQKVNYGPIDPVLSREIFIRSALVQRDYSSHTKFFIHNEKLFKDIEQLEHQSRRQDVLVDDEVVYQFYDELIPADIYNGKSFERWRKLAEQDNPELLYLSRDYLMKHSASGITESQYPNKLNINGTDYKLAYHFEPGHPRDGVSIKVPLALLNTLPEEPFEWLIPGLLRDKVIQLIKSLPKSLRKHFVPVPDYADACIAACHNKNESLLPALSHHLLKMTAVKIPDDAWQTGTLAEHFFMNFDVLDQNNKIIASGRDLAGLKQQLGKKVQQQFSEQIHWEIEQQGFTDWQFNELPVQVQNKLNSISVTGFTALQDDTDSVSIVVVDTQKQANLIHHDGLKRLFKLSLAKQLKYLSKNLPNIQQLCLSYTPFGRCDDLKSAIIDATLEQCFMTEANNIRSHKVFEKTLELGRTELINTANKLCELLNEIFSLYNSIRKQLKKSTKPNWLESIGDIQSQLEHLVYEDFIYYTPVNWLTEYPRYLKAIQQRLGKLQTTAERDRNQTRLLCPYWEEMVTMNDDYYDDAAFSEFRWMLEEFRVSLFAQGLKTRYPVSEKRLSKTWQTFKKNL